MFYVYVLISEKDKKRYVGQTAHLKRRLSEHNNGLVRSTKGRRPLRMVYSEEFSTREEAVRREKELKSGQWRELLNKYVVPW